jgi:ubiquinone/menaquinone biosynthesis C-methylase UbiE
MQPKPDFLGPQSASAFQERSVAHAYQYRPTYPAAVFDILAGLIVDHPRAVLDVGAGTGFLARPLAERVDRVDAVDVSTVMIEQGKRLHNGNHPNLRWIESAVEDVPLHPPYALITAGDSIHWMDWPVVMPRFSRLLTTNGSLAILTVEQLPAPWEGDLWPLRRRYSTIPNFQYYDHIQGLEDRGLFQRVGSIRTEPIAFMQSLDDYIESFHGRAAFSRERMPPEMAGALDADIRALVAPYAGDTVELEIIGEIVWGKPIDPRGAPEA